MNILVIGSSVLDTLISGSKNSKSPGGIFHSTLKLFEIKNADDKISLCTQVSLDSYKYFSTLYDKCEEKFFQNIIEIPKVILEETEDGNRKETYSNLFFPINFENIDFSKYDGILINMITGREFDYKKLDEIRENSRAVIYFDVHSLSRLSDSIGERKLSLIPNFEKWAENLDIIQVNNYEMLSLFNISDEYELAKKLFSYGVKSLIITKAEKGAVVYFIKENELNFYFKQAKKITVENTIGCGDYFGASFFYKFLITKNEILSMNFAIEQVEKTLSRRVQCN